MGGLEGRRGASLWVVPTHHCKNPRGTLIRQQHSRRSRPGASQSGPGFMPMSTPCFRALRRASTTAKPSATRSALPRPCRSRSTNFRSGVPFAPTRPRRPDKAQSGPQFFLYGGLVGSGWGSDRRCGACGKARRRHRRPSAPRLSKARSAGMSTPQAQAPSGGKKVSRRRKRMPGSKYLLTCSLPYQSPMAA